MKIQKSLFKKLQHNPIVAILFLLAVSGAYYYLQSKEFFSSKALVVIDGDTVDVFQGNQHQRIRLAYIDAPEINQPYGKEAKQRLATLIKDKTVIIKPVGKDNYLRTFAVLKVEGININREMVRSGMAWVYSQYNDDLLLLPLEVKARTNKVGLWKQSNPVAPWDYRKKINDGNSIKRLTPLQIWLAGVISFIKF